eukprot:scaffold4082_cov141-Skeletonema_menzelii.AAC.6
MSRLSLAFDGGGGLEPEQFSFYIIIASLIFWVWAIVNTVQNKAFDLGILSFLSVLITHSILLMKRYRRDGECNNSSKCAPVAVLGAHTFVTINYLGGIYVALATDMVEPPERQKGFAIYCGVAAFCWFLSAIAGYKIYSIYLQNAIQ